MTAALAGVLAYVALGLLGLALGRGRETAVLAIACGVASLAFWAPGFPATLLGGPPWGIALIADPWSLGIWGLALFLHTAVLLHAWAQDPLRHSLVTLLVGTCLAGAISHDLFNLYVVLELSSLLSTILVAMEGRSAALWAALRYLLFAGLGMTLYLFGLGFIYGHTGLLSLGGLAENVAFAGPVRVGAGLIMAGMSVKAGVFLLGLWLPRAHGQAPTEVSALLSGLVVKLGVLALARLSQAFPIQLPLIVLGICTGLGGIAYALQEKDLKTMLAHSTVSQLGYMLLGIGLGMETAAFLYLVAHGLGKGLLFLAAGEAVEESRERSIVGLASQVSWPAALGLALGSWTIVGLPPLAGFAAKGVLSHGQSLWVKALLALLGLGTAAAFARLLPLFRGRGRGRIGGLGLLGAGTLAAGLAMILAFPEVPWLYLVGEALIAPVLGFLAFLLLRNRDFPLPRLTLEHGLIAALFASVILTIIA